MYDEVSLVNETSEETASRATCGRDNDSDDTDTSSQSLGGADNITQTDKNYRYCTSKEHHQNFSCLHVLVSK